MKSKCDNCAGTVKNQTCQYCGTYYGPIQSDSYKINSSEYLNSNHSVTGELTLTGKALTSLLICGIVLGVFFYFHQRNQRIAQQNHLAIIMAQQNAEAEKLEKILQVKGKQATAIMQDADRTLVEIHMSRWNQ
jgi:hypothetical protein